MVEIYAADLFALAKLMPDDLRRAKGQLSMVDRCLYYHLAKDHYQGFGSIVDAGALIGCSARVIASGLTRNKRVKPVARVIKSYDLFQDVADGFSAHLIRGYYGEQPVAGAEIYDFEDKFRANIDGFEKLVEVFKGDIKGTGWPSKGPIEFLSIDVAKSPELMWYMAREFMPHLVPGRSLVLHQDFLYPNQPYLFIAMELLDEFFERIYDTPTGSTSVFLFKKQITSADVLDRLGKDPSGWFNLDTVKYIEKSAAKAFTPYGRMMTLAGIPYAYLLLGRHGMAAFAARELRMSELLSQDIMEKIPAVRQLFTRLSEIE